MIIMINTAAKESMLPGTGALLLRPSAYRHCKIIDPTQFMDIKVDQTYPDGRLVYNRTLDD
jgi:hypothetical protein